MQKIRTALCSFGMSGWVFHAPFIHHHNGFELTAVWERSKQLAKEKYPYIHSYTNYEDILANEYIDLIIVNTPNYTHFDLAQKALAANKHVVVEKPFTVSVAQGEALIKLATEKNKLLSVYQNRRFDSDYLTIKKVIDDGLLGEIVEAVFNFDRYSEVLSPKVHKETPGLGTGNLYDLGSHLIDQALQFFGFPEAVFADITKIRTISKVDDYFELILFYPTKRVKIHSTYLAKEASIGYILHGTKGSFIKPKTNVQEIALTQHQQPTQANWGIEPTSDWGLLHTTINNTVVRENIPSLAGNYMNYYEGIYNSIVHQSPLPVTAEEGLAVIKIIEAAYKSNAAKKVIDL